VNRLSFASLSTMPDSVQSPKGRPPGGVGMVHFGPGAFHRAHQAAYVEDLLTHDPRWGIAAVSMRTRGAINALAKQDGLYTLAIRDADLSMRVIGAHRRFLGPEDASETHALLADPAVALVTTSVTEKGYCLAGDGTLDMGHPDIVQDLAGTTVPRSVVGWIVAGLAARRAAGTTPFVPMPCDNLASNGAKLHAALVAFAGRTDASLANWIASEVRVPSTMVDSITPASDAALHADVAATLGVDDRAAVQRESFTQWVIEDIGRPLGPDLASVGATVTTDVGGYEKAKLRILNGAHSTLAYAGLLRGSSSVADAMRDPELAAFVDAMIARDIIPMLPPVHGFDIQAYRAAVLQRFRNPAIVHRLDQIAQDGSQKLPYRLGDTLIANRRAGRMPTHVVAAFGTWTAFLIRRSRSGQPIVDPAGDRLAMLASEGSAADIVARLADEALGIPREVLEDAELTATLRRAATDAHDQNWGSLFAG